MHIHSTVIVESFVHSWCWHLPIKPRLELGPELPIGILYTTPEDITYVCVFVLCIYVCIGLCG